MLFSHISPGALSGRTVSLEWGCWAIVKDTLWQYNTRLFVLVITCKVEQIAYNSIPVQLLGKWQERENIKGTGRRHMVDLSGEMEN